MEKRRQYPPFAALRTFDVFGRCLGIRKAAQILDIDHAAVSRQLKALEGWLGIRLYERNAGGATTLTPDGARYHARIAGALDEIGSASDAVLRRDQQALLIWCSPGLAFHWLAIRLMDFHKLHPGAEIELRPTDMSPDLARNEADGDIRYIRTGTPAPDPGVRCEIFAQPEVFPVVSSATLARLGGIVSAADLLRENLLHEESEAEWQLWFAAQGVTVGERLPGPRLWHAHLLLDAARHGQGIALANLFLVAEDLLRGRLVRLQPQGGVFRPATLGGYGFVARRERWALPVMRQFRSWLRRTADSYEEERRLRLAAQAAGAR